MEYSRNLKNRQGATIEAPQKGERHSAGGKSAFQFCMV